METGKIVQVLGPVVDVVFENGKLPAIKDALEVQNGDKKCVMEVAQHIGNDVVRCVMLASSEGLSRDMEVVATGSGIKTPVGEKTLGRLFNVLGEAIDGGEHHLGGPLNHAAVFGGQLHSTEQTKRWDFRIQLTACPATMQLPA